MRHDLHHAARTLRRSPAFTFPALAALALGVGLGVALLALVDTGLGRLAVSEPPGAAVWERGWSEAARTVEAMQAAGVDALLQILGVATLLVLVVLCANLGILLLARGAARRPEIAMRVVLGAHPARLARQLLAEPALLAALGGGLGLLLGAAALLALQLGWPDGLAPWLASGTAYRALALGLGLPSLALLGVALLPARRAARRDLYRDLAAGERATPGPGEGLLRRWLVVLAVAASILLLVGAGLLLRGFSGPAGVGDRHLGYDPRDTLTMRIELAGAEYVDPAARLAAHRSVLNDIQQLPGVLAGSLATDGAWLGMGTEDEVRAVCGWCSRGVVPLAVTQGTARHHVVSPGYFAALGIAVERGREFLAADDDEAPRVAVVSRVFAHHLFPQTDPLGKPVQVGGRDGEWYTVVGVVDDVRPRGLGSGDQPVPALYLSTLQHAPHELGLAVRTAGDPEALAPRVERAVAAAAAGAAGADVMTMDARLDRFVAPLRWFGRLFGTLAAFAALLAAVGVFGVVSYTVSRRTREMGVRRALGASERDIVRLVLGQGLRLTGAGVWLGVLAAFCLARLLQVLFLGVRPLDPLVYATVVLLLAGVALLASWLPARRAGRVDPMEALRYE